MTEADINRIAMGLIEELMECIYDSLDDQEQTDHFRIATLGNIEGIVDMVRAMRKEMKANG